VCIGLDRIVSSVVDPVQAHAHSRYALSVLPNRRPAKNEDKDHSFTITALKQLRYQGRAPKPAPKPAATRLCSQIRRHCRHRFCEPSTTR